LRNGNDKGLSGVKVRQVLPAVKASEVALDDSCCIVSDSLCASSAAFINDSSRTMPSQVAAKQSLDFSSKPRNFLQVHSYSPRPKLPLDSSSCEEYRHERFISKLKLISKAS
jgi:hypothetical protein